MNWKHLLAIAGAISIGLLASRYLGSAFSGITSAVTSVIPKSTTTTTS